MSGPKFNLDEVADAIWTASVHATRQARATDATEVEIADDLVTRWHMLGVQVRAEHEGEL